MRICSVICAALLSVTQCEGRLALPFQAFILLERDGSFRDFEGIFEGINSAV